MDKPDNPAAFPRPTASSDGPNVQEWNGSQEGMSLRDWFAGQIAASTSWPMMELQAGTLNAAELASEIAEQAYEIADALLAEREKRL